MCPVGVPRPKSPVSAAAQGTGKDSLAILGPWSRVC